MQVEVLDQYDEALVQALVDGVRQFNAKILGYVDSTPLTVVAKSDDGKLMAGVSGRTVYQHFLIEVVWVDESVRTQGLGRKLMEQAEQQAKARGCVAAQVDTLSFQALDFYRKLGFEVIGEIAGFPLGHKRYFMLKQFA